MIELLSAIEHAALGEIIKRVITGAVDWAKRRKRPAPAVIEEKLAELADKNLSHAIPQQNREAAISSIVELARPTFEEIVEYSPNVQQVMYVAKKAFAAKGAKRSSKNTVMMRESTRKAATKKSPSRKVVAAKASPAKKPSATKAVVMRAPAGRKAPGRVQR